MVYATRKDLEARFGSGEIERLDKDGDGSTVEAALTDAAARIDAEISARYVLPITATSVPALLVSAACDLARERLYDENPPAIVTDNADAVRSNLKMIREGSLIILGADGSPLPTRKLTQRSGPEPVHTDDNLGGY